MSAGAPAGEAEAYLGGRLTLRQSADGYRAGIDAALLAAALAIAPGGRAAEFGCGPGAALLSAAVLNPEARLVGLELDAEAAALGRDNVTRNGLDDRVRIETADALGWKGESGLDAVFFNPPFFDDPGALRAPRPEKQAAWINTGGLGDWIEAGLKRLGEGGVLTMIHRADRLADLLAPLEGRAGEIAVLPVHPRAGLAAKRVIVAARKASRAPLRLLPGLVLHGETGSGYRPEAEALLTGAARLALEARAVHLIEPRQTPVPETP